MADDELDFIEEIRQYIASRQVKRVIFGLRNGEKVLSTNLLQASFNRNFVSLYEADGNIVMFPLDQIVTAQILLNEDQ